MSAVMKLEGDKKGSPKRRSGAGDRWQKPAVFQEIYIPRQIRNFCLFLLHGFCRVLNAPN